MQNKALASIAFEIGDKLGDTGSNFLTQVKNFLNERYDDALLKIGATTWSIASTATLGDSDVPLLGLGAIIKHGATSDGYEKKRQFAKAAKSEQKYARSLGDYIISGDPNQFLPSFSRYGYHV